MPIKQATPAEARALAQDGWKIVDVRTIAEFDGGHPEGAANIPLGPEFLTTVEQRFPKGTKLVLSCQSGNRSQRAATALEAQGWTDLVNVAGGIVAWARAGLPVEKKA